ncbi:MAG: zinc ribbon domain-containing protein [Defluviitaleaceae bacterium]|nr:zinc ribbon domain-containing protein [Defluviitaleaceae bacterium]
MLKSLLKGVSMGTGMGIGQELTGTVIQHIRNRGQQSNNAGGWDIKCRCGELNTADSRFCGSCGSPVVARCNLQSGVRCSCGFTNVTGQKFCSECGNRLG